MFQSSAFFSIDALATLMIALVSFMGCCIASFSYRYLQGDSQFRSFFIQLVALIFSVLIMVSANDLILLWGAWCVSNALLVRLMIHKSSWKAARASGTLAAKNYLLGALCMAIAFILLYLQNGDTNIQVLIHENSQSPLTLVALIFLLIAAMTQSAIYPFHRWLISSLNSPTPTSALMHAGIVNGGGLVLTRFALLFLQVPYLLTVIFIIGVATALIGTLWKLMQNDVKRMLACSTLGQMGFMIAQCGLGLFPAAVTHLIWHGLFKAYLFLASGSAAQEKRLDLGYPPKKLTFICALVCGAVGSFGFAFASGKSWDTTNTTLVIMMVAFLAATQFSLPILRSRTLKNLLLALLLTSMMSFIYGYSIYGIASIMEPMKLMRPQPINVFHIIGMILLSLAWLSILFIRNDSKRGKLPTWMLKNYVLALNASQPHPSTITTYRKHYQNTWGHYDRRTCR